MSEPLPFRLRLTLALRESQLTSKAKLCGFVVVSYMNDEGAAWPSLDALEHGTSTTRKTVLNALDELEASGFVAKVRGHHVNTYFPRLTPELERLVAEFLDRARRRDGQLPLPLDGRGLSVVDGSRVESLHPQSGATPRQSGATPPEVVREVVSEIGTGLVPNNESAQDLSDPLTALVADLADADAGTLYVFRKKFGQLSAWNIEHAHDELRRRRTNPKRSPLVSEAAYVSHALDRYKTGAA